MKIMIEVPDETHSIMVRCFDDSGLLTNDYFVEHEGLEIIGAVDTISRKEAIEVFDPENPRDWYTPWIIETLEQLPGRKPEILKCKDCDWWEKQEASLQGRCGQWGIYPTGEWYCGNARRRQDE